MAGAVRAGAAVAGDPGRLRRGGALLPGPGRRLLRARLEVGQGLRDVFLRPSLPPHGGLLLRLRQGMPRWVAGPRVGRRPFASSQWTHDPTPGTAAQAPGSPSPFHPGVSRRLSWPTSPPSSQVHVTPF